MLGIKINVKTKTVELIEIEKNSLPDIYAQLECTTIDCPIIFKNNDGLYVDDEGMYAEPIGCFTVEGYNQVYFGHGLILGTSDEGESEDVKSSLQYITNKITFISADDTSNLAGNTMY
jgi:hypothetical protein